MCVKHIFVPVNLLKIKYMLDIKSLYILSNKLTLIFFMKIFILCNLETQAKLRINETKQLL